MKNKLTQVIRFLANLSKGWLAAIAICVALFVLTLGGVVGRLTKPAPAPQIAPVAVEVNELAEVSDAADTVDAGDTTEDPEDEDDTTTEKPEDTDVDPSLLEDPTPLLEELMESDDPSDWLLAAQQPDATSSQLEELAQRASSLDYYETWEEDIQMSCDILDAIATHKDAPASAYRPFLDSIHTEVWLELASQPADEGTLILLARQAAAYEGQNTSYEEDEATQLAIAQALASNSATTSKVMAELQRSAFDSVKEVKLT